jgi:hypothetical protein
MVSCILILPVLFVAVRPHVSNSDFWLLTSFSLLTSHTDTPNESYCLLFEGFIYYAWLRVATTSQYTTPLYLYLYLLVVSEV